MKRWIPYALGLFLTHVASAETWKIATLEWPPYTCSKCYRNGAAADALRGALRKKGVTVEFVFYPWVQAQKMGNQRSFVGYFPAWREEVLPQFYASEALFSSPVVFLERKSDPLSWTNLGDLKGKTFGVTEGYGNTEEFNNLVKSGIIKTVTVLSEESNFPRLASGSVDGVLIDYYVGHYYLKNQFAKYADQLQLNTKTVEDKDLFVAFNEHSKKKNEILSKAVSKAHFQKAIDGYIEDLK